MRRVLVGSFASAAIAALVIGSATVASATHTVELGDRANLVTKGVAVLVPVEVTCLAAPFPPPPVPIPPFPPFPGSSVSVSMSQRSGNRIAQGFGTASVVCNGTPQTVNVQVMAQQAPFKSGTALATAAMSVCDISGCHTSSDTEEIRIRH